jgi:selenocysteine-specific elongation factor
LPEEVTQQALEPLLRERKIMQVGKYWFVCSVWEKLISESKSILEEYHRCYPLRKGMPREEWRARLQLSARLAGEVIALLVQHAMLEVSSGNIWLSGFEPSLTKKQMQQVEELLKAYERQGIEGPLTRQEAEVQVGVELVRLMIERGQLTRVGEQILLLPAVYTGIVERIQAYLREHGKIGVAETRDLLGTTRKYVVPFLEHLDAMKITKRQGDERYLIAR